MNQVNPGSIPGPQLGTLTMNASRFTWGRIIGRINLAIAKLQLDEFMQTIIVKSDTTGRELVFTYNGIKQPFVRGKYMSPYAEWICDSIDPKLSKLKLHLETIGYRRP